MIDNGDIVQVISAIAEAVLLFGAALFLTFSRPVRHEKRVLAVFLAFVAFGQSGQFGLVFPADAQAFNALFYVSAGGAALATMVFAWRYPRAPRVRSWATLLLAVASLNLLAIAVLFPFHGQIHVFDAPPGHAGAMVMSGEAVYGWGSMLAKAAIFGAILLRAREMPEPERTAAPIVGVALFADFFTRPAGYVLAWAAQAVGIDPPFHPLQFGEVLGDPYHLLAPLVFLGRIVLPAFFVVVLVRVWRLRLPFVVLAVAALAELPGYVGPVYPYGSAPLVLSGVLPLYAIDRYDAFGTRAVPVGVARLLAGSVGVGVFVATLGLVFDATGDSAYGAAFAVVAGLVAAALATVLVLPRTRAWGALRTREDPTDIDATARRLAPYRAALEHDLGMSAGDDTTTFERLRALRSSLGVSDREHATLLYAMRHTRDANVSGASRAPAPGELFLGRYRFMRELGMGGAGVSRLYHDERANRDVVIKTLRGTASTPDGVSAVLREARSLARVRHENVVQLFDVEQIGNEAFLIMEFAEAGSLAARLASGALPRAAFERLARDLLSGLEAVHAAGLVHRDVKPSNVLLSRDGTAKLADFGVAHLPGFETTAGGVGGAGAVGTVRYMSPEQARGRRVDARSDLFGAAATLYEALTGAPYRTALAGESAIELQMRIAAEAGFDGGAEPPELRAWFAKALAAAPSERFASAREMREAFDAALAAV